MLLDFKADSSDSYFGNFLKAKIVNNAEFSESLLLASDQHFCAKCHGHFILN